MSPKNSDTEFPNMEKFCLLWTGQTAEAGQDYYHHVYDKIIEYWRGDAETFVHELIHWAVATKKERKIANLGLDTGIPPTEKLVMFLEQNVYLKADCEWEMNEENDSGWQDLIAEWTWRDARKEKRMKNVPKGFLGALAEALRADSLLSKAVLRNSPSEYGKLGITRHVGKGMDLV